MIQEALQRKGVVLNLRPLNAVAAVVVVVRCGRWAEQFELKPCTGTAGVVVAAEKTLIGNQGRRPIAQAQIWREDSRFSEHLGGISLTFCMHSRSVCLCEWQWQPTPPLW